MSAGHLPDAFLWGTATAAFCGRAAADLGDVIRRACMINEPNVVAAMGWLAGIFPPGKSDRELRHRVNGVFVDAHRRAVEAIRRATPGVPVGLTLAMTDYQAAPGGEDRRDRIRHAMEVARANKLVPAES